jgi:hypothetical protein
MTERQFATLTENCDWEGETWVFFVLFDGNESELNFLAQTIDDAGPYFEGFELDLDNLVPEHEVDVLVKHSPSGYMNLFNKVDGEIELPPGPTYDIVTDSPVEEIAAGWLNDTLYKGGIEGLIKK